MAKYAVRVTRAGQPIVGALVRAGDAEYDEETGFTFAAPLINKVTDSNGFAESATVTKQATVTVVVDGNDFCFGAAPVTLAPGVPYEVEV